MDDQTTLLRMDAAADVLTEAGHKRWSAREQIVDEPRFVIFTRGTDVLVGVHYAGQARDEIVRAQLAALVDAGLPAQLASDGYIHLLGRTSADAAPPPDMMP